MSLDISLHQDAKYNTQIYEANITHNLGKMAGAVLCFHLENDYPDEKKYITLHDILWHGSGQSAKVITPMLEVGLKELIENEVELCEYIPENGWGSYAGLIKFTRELLFACKEFPETTLRCHR